MKKIIVILLLLITLNVKAISINDYSNGIDGRIIQKSILTKLDQKDTEDSLIISSKTGIYINKGNEYKYIKTDPSLVSVIVVDDINNDSVKDIVYALNSKDGNYNIVAISGKDESVLWKNTLTEKTFDYSRVFSRTNIVISKIEQVDKKIVVISDYSLYVLDIKTGKLSYKYNDKDNIWDVTEIKDINNNLNNEIAISNQLGEVKVLDSKTGKILWNQKIIEDLTFKSKNPVTRNVWQVESYKEDLYAVGEDGTLYKLDHKTGKIKDKLILDTVEIKDLEEYYTSHMKYGVKNLYPTNKTSEFYKNYEAFFYEDHILVSSYLNALDRNTNINKKQKPKVYKIKDFKVVNDIEVNISLFNVEPIELDNHLYVPVEIKDENLIINKYDYETKKAEPIKLYISNYFKLDKKDNIYINKIKDNILLEQLNNSSLILNKDFKSITKNNNSYSIANIIRSNNDELIVSYKSNDIVHKIEYYDDLNKESPTWEYNITKDFKNNGLFSISMEQDYNRDGKKDITALINKVDDKNRTISTYFLILNSKDGSVIKFKNIHTGYYIENGKRVDTYLTGNNLIPIKDINRDGISELIVDSTIINGNNISVLGVFDISVNTSSSKILSVGDINNDSITDIAVIESEKATIYQSSIIGNNINYGKTNKVIKYPKNVSNEEGAISIPDLNKDGIKELVFNDRDNNKKQVFKVYSGKDLSLLFTITDNYIFQGSQYAFLNDDINNDGYNDFYSIAMGNIYKFLSGKDGTLLYEINLYPENEQWYDKFPTDFDQSNIILPFIYSEVESSATVGIDINNDSKKEIFIIKEEYYPKVKLVIDAYDINNKNKKPIRTLDIYFEQNNYYGTDVYVDTEYSKSITEVVNGENLFTIKSPGYKNTIIYDALNNKVLSEINTKLIKSIKTSANNIFGVTLKNNPIYINFDNDFTITNLSKDKSPLSLKLNDTPNNDLRVVKIYNKGDLIDTKYSDKFDLKLKRGTQNLTFKSYDIWGKTQNYNLNITINKFNPYLIVSSVLSILFIILIIYLSIGYKFKRKSRIRRIHE